TIIYWVFARDDQGCKGQANVKIDVEEIICGKPNIFVANIFTPNGDGKNDILRVEGDFIENIYFAIFDRWGEKVFETKDKNKGWDGKHRGKECIQGVYYYRLEVECEKGKTYFGSGDVTLVR
ncbi:MAG: gliding motility-associated C-terminal domain-containing protein, partial [Bacteroidales bacterium]